MSPVGLGDVYNAIVTQEIARFSLGKTVLIGLVTFSWPIMRPSLMK